MDGLPSRFLIFLRILNIGKRKVMRKEDATGNARENEDA